MSHEALPVECPQPTLEQPGCGACCFGGMVFDLNDEEYAYMVGRGNVLRKQVVPLPTDAQEWQQDDGSIDYGAVAGYYAEHIWDHDSGTRQHDEVREKYWFASVMALGRAVYAMDELCTNLDMTTNLCVDYENRPRSCQTFVPGSEACQKVRERAGLVPVFISSQQQ